MRWIDRLAPALASLALLLVPGAAAAHALLPSLWQAEEISEGRVQFVWATPAQLPVGVLPPTPRLPADCTDVEDHRLERTGA